MKKYLVSLMVLVLLSFLSMELFAIPAPSGMVNDLAGVLTPATKKELIDIVEKLKADTGVEVAVVTVNDFENMSMEDFAEQLFKQWGIGKKGIDNGILFLKRITGDPKERGTTRLEIGYGLEGIINDAKAGRILDENVMTYFFEGKYNEGFLSGVKAIDSVIRTEGVTVAGLEKGEYRAEISPVTKIFMSAFLLVFLFVGGRGLGNAFKNIKTGKKGVVFPLIFNLIFIGIPLIILLSVVGTFAVIPFLFLIGFIIAGYKYGDVKTGKGKIFSSSSTFFSGSNSRSGSGSSFGGGSSGGGGASR